MTKRTAIKTTIPEIVDYWFSRVYEGDLSVDASEAHERCRRYGYQTKLECCHIIPHSRGGADEPSNLVLLCKKCHLENPNVSDPEIMWDWLKADRTSLYNTFGIIQGFEEYKKIYGVPFSEQVMKLGILKSWRIRTLDCFKNGRLHSSFRRISFEQGNLCRNIENDLQRNRKRPTQNLGNAKILRKS